ncbi:MAG: Tad domain-containing protein [Myxococcales bacterium]|nr:Tad domain-containing protein [Myxococcales bacterium]
MLQKWHELRRSEEGQTLVLAAIFGLILMLCVLCTVNLGRAVYDKVQLQAAADSAAYSEAAVEARVMNLTAYTNRAMVVHYASAMAMTSYLTWLHFMWTFVKPILTVLKFIPVINTVATAVDQILQTLITVMDWAIVILIPALSANNVFLWGVQEGAWLSTWARLGKSISPEAHSGDSAAHPYHPIWPEMIPAMNAVVFSQTRGQMTVPQATLQTGRLLLNNSQPEIQEARLHMVEIANSARTPWVAYGDNYPSKKFLTISPAARHFFFGINIGIGSLGIGNVGRTELGTFPPGGSAASSKTYGQIWSGQRFQGLAKLGICPACLKGRLNIFNLVAVDDLLGNPSSPRLEQYYVLWRPPKLIEKAIPGLGKALDKVANSVKTMLPKGQRLFAISPYVYFVPNAHVNSRLGMFGPNGNFNQPDVLVGLAKQGIDYDREAGAAKYYGHRFTWNGRGAGTGTVDMGYTDKDWPTIPGLPRQLTHRGLSAFSAAQVYYHRPGEWREQPNFFNPLWGARLMPVMESNVLQRLALGKVQILKNLVMH